MDKEAWFKALEVARTVKHTDRDNLRAMLTSELFLAAVHQALQTERLSVEAFHRMDFNTDAGVKSAIRLQGRIDGVIQFLDELFELTQENEDGTD